MSIKDRPSRKSKGTAEPRIDARVTPEVKERIRYAAELQGRNMTDFMVATLVEAANRAIEEHHVLRLSVEDSQVFAAALLNPPEPNKALVRAATRLMKKAGKQWRSG
jgi:uncharacterized protein (DUF1778 family)